MSQPPTPTASARAWETLRRVLARLRGPARRVADWIPLRPLGVVALAAGAAVLYWLAWPTIDLVMLVLGFGLIGMVLASLLVVVLAAVAIKLAAPARTAAASPEGVATRTVETQRSLPTGFSMPHLWFVPLVQVWWEWEEPRASIELKAQHGRLHEDAELDRRGVIRGVRRRLVIQDAFGLARIGLRHDDPVEITVLPHMGALRDLPTLVSLSGGDDLPHPMGIDDGDRVELRRYVPGDPARFIHWKVYGRTRKLMVRVPERALTRARRTIAYLVSGEGDEASAGAARVAVQSGTLGPEWIFGADGTAGEASDAGAAVDKIVRSGAAKAEGGAALRGFVQRAERTGPAQIVVFVPAVTGPWLDRVVTVARERPARVKVVIATDGIDAQPPRPRWRALLTADPEREGTPVAELDKVIAALASTRCEIVVVDRKTGRRLGDAHRRAMRAIAGAPVSSTPARAGGALAR